MPRLRRFARALTGHAADADDLVQLSLERALSRAGQLKPGAAVAGWMFGIVRNAWIDELRTRRRRGRFIDPAAEAEAVADAAAGTPAGLLAVQQAVARLPEEQASAVALVLIEGYSYQEAAEVLQVPIGTLTSRLARAREALQGLLGTDGSGS